VPSLLNIKFGKDLLIVNALSVALILSVFLLPDSFLRSVLGVPFVLFFPGYCLIAVLFPSEYNLQTIERLILSVGLSLALVALIGLTLNYTPFGINLPSILVFMFTLIILLSALTIYRRSKLPVSEA
jgi:uncharacterized membrane protein